MEEKNSVFSLNRRLLRALRRRARGEGGVTLVEMMVSLFIFAIVSTMFTVSIVQYLHSTTADAIRTRSATEIGYIGAGSGPICSQCRKVWKRLPAVTG